MMQENREFLSRLFHAAIAASDPYTALKPYFLRSKPKARTYVIGFGKASVAMAAAFEKLWHEAGWGLLEGFIVTREGQNTQFKHLEVLSASHPLPDARSLHAGERAFREVASLGADDQLIALVSGGGSALLALPGFGLDLADKIHLNQLLLASGAPIHAMNAIRGQISRIKAGRLAEVAHPAKVITYVISDVPGDNPALVSSGPTIAADTNIEAALKFIEHYHIILTPKLKNFFKQLEKTEKSPVSSSNICDFERDETYLIASARTSLLAAIATAKKEGIDAVLLSDAIEGEARDIALMHGALAREIHLHNHPFHKPIVLLSGGETTVTLEPGVATIGSGGRNSEFALSLSMAIAGFDNITALAADTDGIDGLSQSAGAFCDGSSVARLHALGIDPLSSLRDHNSAAAFAKLGDSFTTGPTGTNVNDFRAILIS